MKISRKKSKIVWLFFVWIIIQTGLVFSANMGDIIITEFFFKKSVGSLPEYIELFNNTESSINLNGWKIDIDNVEVEIDAPIIIKSFDYVVILSSTGTLKNEDGTTYCSSSHYGFPFNICDSKNDNLFWKVGTFFDLNNSSGLIKVLDKTSDSNLIDSVLYDIATNFPVGESKVGKAAVFIIDPKYENVRPTRSLLDEGTHPPKIGA